MEIRKLTAANEEQYKNDTQAFYDLGITSQKAAVLLNFLLAKKLSFCPSKLGYYYNTKNGNNVNGGGLLIKGEARVTINDMNEVGIFFQNRWSIDKYVRVASGRAETIKSIKDKIGNELKKLWKNFRDEKIIIDPKEYTKVYGQAQTLELDPNILTTLEAGQKSVVISLNEYRALYEFLKGRDSEKIKERYGITAFNTMVGHRIEDQFLLSAIDVIKNEIKNVEHECTELCKKAEDDFNEAYKELRVKRDATKGAAEKAKFNKIAELQAQIKDLLNTTLGMAAQ